MGLNFNPQTQTIFNVLWELKKDGYAEETIKGYAKRLKHLEHNIDLDKPEQVKAYISQKDVSNAYKEASSAPLHGLRRF